METILDAKVGSKALMQSFEWTSRTHLIDCHSSFIVVHTGKHKIYSRSPTAICQRLFEGVEASHRGDIHGVALKLNIRINATQGLSRSICFGHA